jgi:ketosteroid isomerase-like protein
VERSAVDVVVAFNDAINARDLPGLVALMSPDHLFADSAGAMVAGRDACGAAWASFFESFPDYRNEFEGIDELTDGEVVATGRSVCAFDALDGPARWHATVTNGLVTTWMVVDPAEPP